MSAALLMTPVTARSDLDPGWIHVDAPYVMKSRMDALNAKWDERRRMFKTPLTWGNCLALRTELGADLTLDESLDTWARAYRRHAKGLTDLREEHERELHRPDDPGFDTLFAHQMSGIDLIKRSFRLHQFANDGMGARYLIMDEMGCGKTRVALGAISELDASPVIVLCPKSVIRVWSNEARLFFPTQDIREVFGTPTQRRKALTPGGFMYIMSYESLRLHSRVLWYPGTTVTDAQRAPREVQALGAKMLIVDEVHRCASPQTIQTRAAWAVADEVQHVIAMTGTPIQESPEDLWAVLRLLDRRSFPGVVAFRKRYLDVVDNPFGGYDVRGLNPSTKHEFFDMFHTMSRRATKKQVLPYLPPKVYEIRWVSLPTDNRRAYRQMEKQYLLEVNSGAVTSASNPMVAAARLIQLANATLDVLPGANPGDDDLVRMTNPSPKVGAFMSDIADGDYDGTSVVVFSDSKQLIDLLAEAFDTLKTPIPYVMITGDVPTEDRNIAIKRFQSGEVQYIFITRAGDTGITLTKASTMVRLTRSWSYINHSQAEDRVHRPGSEQHDSILYIDYVAEDTLEEGQIVRLNSKREKATEVLSVNDLKELMTR